MYGAARQTACRRHDDVHHCHDAGCRHDIGLPGPAWPGQAPGCQFPTIGKRWQDCKTYSKLQYIIEKFAMYKTSYKGLLIVYL